MYPRNAASPPSVAVGAIYAVADGTIQTSGASVRVLTAGGAWGAGAGTLSYDTTSGCIFYAPTQGETNGEWFIVAVYKASCTSASVTVVTSASATAGKAVVSSNEDKTGYTASTVSDKTGYALTSVYDAAKTAAQAGNQMDLVNAPNATALTAIGAKVEAMVLDEGDATALLAAIAAKVEEFLINEGDATATLAAIAAAIRTNLAVELARIDAAISSRLATAGYTAPDNASVTAIKSKTDQLNFTGTDVKATLDGETATLPATPPEGYGSELTEEQIDEIAAAVAAGAVVPNVTFSVRSTVSSGQVVSDNITHYQFDKFGPKQFTIQDEADDPIDVSGCDLVFLVYAIGRPGTVLWSLSSADGEITVGGTDNNQVVVLATDDADTDTPGVFRYKLQDTTTDRTLARGVLTITEEADVPSV
jgi:hypothetical protein